LWTYSDLVGIRFLDRGRNPSTGVDCWGLIMLAMKKNDVDIQDFRISCHSTIDIHGAFSIAAEGWRKMEAMEEGDVVAMAMDPHLPDVVQHFGYAVDDTRVLHTMEKMGSVIMRFNHPFIKYRIRGFYRWTR
jgi:cell wall-associated NlpC family hydrolase